jgi:lipoic acid synthetase
MEIIKKHGIGTVCEDALCPNLGECWKDGVATFLIMGSICSRNCSFCNIPCGTPRALDPSEPTRVAMAIRELELKYVVITSVTRDDLPDGGAAHFAEMVQGVRDISPETKIEVLTSDFGGATDAIATMVKSNPDVFAHNIEIVKRLHHAVKRAPSNYNTSLKLLKYMKELSPGIVSKSGLIVGVGETKDDVIETLNDLYEAGVDIVTIGQYLSPPASCLPVARYLHVEEFQDLCEIALGIGIKNVVSGPLVRSSYKANESYSSICSLKR